MKDILQIGKEYSVSCYAKPEESLRFICTQIAQRNWSRVGAGYLTTTEPGEPETRVFLKQFVSSSGQWHEQQCEYEKQGALLARQALNGIAHIPHIHAIDQTRLLHVYEHCEVITLDELLRINEPAFEKYFPQVIAIMGEVLDKLQSLPSSIKLDSLSLKHRPYGTNRQAINFKGIDIRNVGIMASSLNKPENIEVVMFDFGRPYLAPIEEAAAKLFVSVGLLNWGRPMRRFVRGPDTRLLASSHAQLKMFIDPAAVQAERDLQKRFRSKETKAPDKFTKILKNAGIKTVGQNYFRTLNRWCTRNLSPSSVLD